MCRGFRAVVSPGMQMKRGEVSWRQKQGPQNCLQRQSRKRSGNAVSPWRNKGGKRKKCCYGPRRGFRRNGSGVGRMNGPCCWMETETQGKVTNSAKHYQLRRGRMDGILAVSTCAHVTATLPLWFLMRLHRFGCCYDAHQGWRLLIASAATQDLVMLTG